MKDLLKKFNLPEPEDSLAAEELPLAVAKKKENIKLLPDIQRLLNKGFTNPEIAKFLRISYWRVNELVYDHGMIPFVDLGVRYVTLSQLRIRKKVWDTRSPMVVSRQGTVPIFCIPLEYVSKEVLEALTESLSRPTADRNLPDSIFNAFFDEGEWNEQTDG